MSPAADAVLQLSNDYLQQDVYRHLTDGLAARGVRQFVFMSARKQSVTDRCPKDEPLVRYAAPNILKLHHKVMFRMKSELIYSVVERTYDLSLVGGRGRSSPPHAPRPWIQWIPHVADRLALREIVRRHHIFMMPSFSETFGVAYVESLSQGLPAIHSRGQGISGLFEDGVTTEAVDPRDHADMANAIEHVARRRLDVFDRCIAATKGYRWSAAAERMHAIYREAGLPGGPS